MPDWSFALWEAAGQGDRAAVLRRAREELGWSQARLGARFGCSAATISRFETGRRPLRDVTVLRRFATILGLPAAAFGLTEDRPVVPGSAMSAPRLGTGPSRGGDDQVRRRAFLHVAALTGSVLAWPDTGTAVGAGVDPAAALAGRLGDALLGPTRSSEPAPVNVLVDALGIARQEFTACRYLQLATRLPALITAAETTAAQRVDPNAQRVLARSYNLATRVLVKLEASGLEWVSADRALRAARTARDPLTLAEAQRLVASVARRAGHHERAQALTLAAASQLDVSGPPEHLAMYGTLHLSAAYAAARSGDRDRTADLLAEAEVTANRLAGDHDRHRALVANLVSHRVSAAYLLGDAGTALAAARSLPLAAVPTTERRARLLVDIAQAWQQWDKPGQAYRTLLAAERSAPGEVRTRNAVRRLVGVLMDSPRQAAMPGLPALARRVHLVA